MSTFEDACATYLERRGRGVKVERRMTVACEHGRRLAEVVRVNRRDILAINSTVWVNPHAHLAPWRAPEPEPQAWPADGRKPIRREHPMLLDPGSGADQYEIHLASSCCSRTTTLGWVRACLEGSARRVVLRPDAP
jgi:hypothetical protein